jgi:tight adherence protein B
VVIAASAATGCFVALLVAALCGRLPRTWRPTTPRPAVTARQTWLLQAGARVTPTQFVAGSALIGAVVFALLLAATRTPVVAIAPAVAGALLPRAYFARRRTERLREIQGAWPEGLRELTAAISAGLSLNQALSSLAVRGPEPLRAALGRYPLLANVLGVVSALEVVKEELADPTSDRVIEVLIIAHERGGHLLPEILSDLADTTTRDVRTRQELETDALEQRINARAVFILPWLVLLVLVAQPGHFQDFYRGAGGALVVAIGALLSLVGAWLVGRMSREEVEERVLGSSAPPPADVTSVGGWPPEAAA